MDNRTLDVTSEGDKSLTLAMELGWNPPGGKATHYKIMKLKPVVSYYTYKEKDGITSHSESLRENPEGTPTLLLLWHEERNAQQLPFPHDKDASFTFVRNWLRTSAEFGHEPDHDGSNGQGFRVFTEAWGHVADHHYAIFAVQPAWAMYGK